jgi:hypothetical protein
VTFKKGESGNPQGRKLGAVAMVTTQLRAVIAKDAKAIVESITASAKAGDIESRKMFVRLLPQSSWPVTFDLPKIESIADIPQAVRSALEAASAGKLTIEDAEKIIGLLNGLRAAYEGLDLVKRLDEMQMKLDALTTQAGGQQ